MSRYTRFTIYFLFIFAGFLFVNSKNVQAAEYFRYGTVVSENLLASTSGVTWVTGFSATTTIPASSTLQIQFSQNGIGWESSTGTMWTWDTLASGTNSIDISALHYATSSFFYKLQFTNATSSVTATIKDIDVEYSTSLSPPTSYFREGTMESNNLLDGAGSVSAISEFKATVVMPASTTLWAQFSQNGITWQSSTGTSWGWDALTDGANTVDLSALSWNGAQFYYKLKFLSELSSSTPVLSNVEVVYTAGTPDTEYFPKGTILSGDIIAGDTEYQVLQFAYNLEDLPSGAQAYVQFSLDNSTFYSADGTTWGWSALSSGNHLSETSALDISDLGWITDTFYYKVKFSNTNTAVTPVLTEVGILDTGQPYGASAYWSLDEGFGTIVHDEAPPSGMNMENNNGTINGAVWKDESDCVSGKCLRFDGNSDYVEIEDFDF